MAKIAKNGNVAGKGRIGGRAKGTPNKLTKSVKEAIEAAADGLGGAQRLQDWAASNPANERVFWGTIYPKLLPLQIGGAEGLPPIGVSHSMDKDAASLIDKIRGT